MKIRDWKKFQHYQDGTRKPEWIKLYRSLLDDLNWHRMSGDDAKALTMLWMLASEHGGTLPPVDVIAFRLRMTEKQIKSILYRLPEWIEPSDSEVLADCYQGASPEEEKEEQETSRKKNENRASAIKTDFLKTFWPLYPHKVGKPVAFRAYLGARQKVSNEEILAGLKTYIRSKPPDRQWCNPATWLNQERWGDVFAPSKSETANAQRKHFYVIEGSSEVPEGGGGDGTNGQSCRASRLDAFDSAEHAPVASMAKVEDG